MEGRFVYVSVSAHALNPLYLHTRIVQAEAHAPEDTYVYVAHFPLAAPLALSTARSVRVVWVVVCWEEESVNSPRLAGRALLAEDEKRIFTSSIHPTIPLPTLPLPPPIMFRSIRSASALAKAMVITRSILSTAPCFLCFLMIRTIPPLLAPLPWCLK